MTLSVSFLYPNLLFSYTTLFSLQQYVLTHVLLLLHFQYQTQEYRNTPNQFNPDFKTEAFYSVEMNESVFHMVAQ